MNNEEQKRWQMLQQALEAEISGKGPRPVRSTRTLFGIPSHVEEVLSRVATEDDARCQQALDCKIESSEE